MLKRVTARPSKTGGVELYVIKQGDAFEEAHRITYNHEGVCLRDTEHAETVLESTSSDRTSQQASVEES